MNNENIYIIQINLSNEYSRYNIHCYNILDELFDISNSFDISKLKGKEVSVTKYVMNRELCYTRIYCQTKVS